MFDRLESGKPQRPTEATMANVSPVLASTLLPHQEEGLAWMVQREANPDPTGAPELQHYPS